MRGLSRARLRGIADELDSARGSGALPGLVYERLVMSAFARIRGFVGLRFIRVLYRRFSVGANPRCWGKPSVVMAPGSSITIGDRLWAVSDFGRGGIALYSKCKLRTMKGAEIVIGDGVELNGTSITCQKRIEIGSGTLIAANVVIVDADFHRHWPSEQRSLFADEGRPVTIGRNVWIGMGTLILKGTKIGDRSIIGAGSVVTGEIPANVVAAGNPARVLRELTPET